MAGQSPDRQWDMLVRLGKDALIYGAAKDWGGPTRMKDCRWVLSFMHIFIQARDPFFHIDIVCLAKGGEKWVK